MAINAYILKDKEEYSIDKIKDDIRIIATRLKLHLKEAEPNIKADGSFSSLQFTIFDDVAFNVYLEGTWGEEINQGQSLGIYIYAIDEKYESDKMFDWIEEGRKLHKIIYFDDIEYNEELVYKFVYEYLKLNTKDYFWDINNWAYTLEDLKKVNKLPFDENWCYKNPKLI